ncbi:ribonuclease III [Microbacterium memoriense]|uniref:Ribonuclease 3 n=1 Tax=Microbacterium memoriense TaxID=2978350 RepID=A0ABT2PAU2_9MICO|nr:ribonuclease III [Microbacterium memoriense]MCT9001539.1 ribonuclease III [Microbacterium memoriense]
MTDISAEHAVLTDKLGVDIDPELLSLALTHRSYAYENGGLAHNERLEFLGDSILGQAVTVHLFTTHPGLDEGSLAKRRASVVSTVALAEVARTIGLGAHIRLGRGEDQTGGRDKDSILADTMEAVIGAAFLSAGAEASGALVLRLVAPLMADPERYGAAMDPKTSLQERAAQLGMSPPVYTVIAEGPDHNRMFTATVAVSEVERSGVGSSKKQAEMAAALAVWHALSDRA